jgi:hypothetical protein
MSSGFGSLAAAQGVADAVMCEGQVLYPYRASAGKNQLRWQFGVLTPRAFTEQEDSDRWAMKACAVLDGTRQASELVLRARFLRTRSRSVLIDGLPVPSAEAAGRLWTSFDDAEEECLDAGPVSIEQLCAAPVVVRWSVPAERAVEAPGPGVGVHHEAAPIEARLSVRAERLPGPYGLIRVEAVLENLSSYERPAQGHARQHALRSSLISCHLIGAVSPGRWLSVMDPPEFAAGLVTAAHQTGCYPVLIGDDSVILAAPIILYDHPEVAPESAGDFCDATEIDEILALRTLTLTDDEKREARATDGRAAAILDRCDQMPPEIWERLHGAVRSMKPAVGAPEKVVIAGVEVGPGTTVVLKPVRSADAQDVFLIGRRATVHEVVRDFDGDVHISVALDEDPGADVLEWYGRYRYFRTHEVEPVS